MKIENRVMRAHEHGSDDWWTVVLSMPAEERLAALEGYRAMLVEQNLNKPTYLAAAHLLTRVNFEIKRTNRLICGGDWYDACRNVLDQEQFDAVRVERERLQRRREETLK